MTDAAPAGADLLDLPAAPEPPRDDTAARGDADPPADTPGGIDLTFRPDVEGLTRSKFATVRNNAQAVLKSLPAGS